MGFVLNRQFTMVKSEQLRNRTVDWVTREIETDPEMKSRLLSLWQRLAGRDE